jgi:hypothetical protein
VPYRTRYPMLALLSAAPFADGSLTPDELSTLIDLVFSPFLVIASLTTFVVGWSAWLAFYQWRGTQYVRDRIENTIAFATVRAFVVSIPPAIFLLFSTIDVYT